MIRNLQVFLKKHPLPALILLFVIPLLVAFGGPWWLCFVMGLVAIFIWQEPDTQVQILAKSMPRHLAPDVLKAFFDHSDRPMIFLDAEDSVIHTNKAMKALKPSLEINAPITNIFRNPIFLETLKEVKELKLSRSIEFESQKLNNRSFEAEFTSLDPDFSRIMKAAVLIELHDRTERVRTEETRRDFIANASHELRTPLAAIKGGIETINEHRGDSDALKTFLPIMQSQTFRMERLIDDLFSLSQIETQREIEPDARADLYQIATDILDTYNSKDKELSKRIYFDLPKSEIWVNGDSDQLHQVLINLIDNSLKYGKEAGDVIITLAPEDARYKDKIGLSIRDSGKGIDPHHIPRLTERFYRVDHKDKSGTGLGLAIVKHILRRHHGDLHIQSKSGQGSNFTIWLNPAN